MKTTAMATPPAGRLGGLRARLALRSRARSLLRGAEGDPRWVRPALIGLLLATAALYLWDLGSSGWANAYYSAAVQAATKSWKAFFFGSLDAASFITVDKPPFSLWVMGLSARIFGVSSWSILVPQALEGAAAVGLLYAAVRRWSGPAAGLLAGAVLALTPVAALMFRFNNPDALLVLLLVAAAYATVRAIESGSTWWLAAAGALVGAGFNTKMLQAFLVVPALALAYGIAGPTRLRRRLGQIALAGVALLVSSSWWVAVVELWPEAARPYIGGSQDNSLLNLIFGYNGLGRLSGEEAGSVGGMGAAGSRWGATGWTRLFDADWGGQIAWLLPAALIFMVALFWLSRRAARTDRLRAAALIWGGWLLITAAVFSFGAGIIHQYYAVALAPPIGALVGIGAVALWERRRQLAARLTLAAALAATSVCAFLLLGRSADWLPALRFIILIGGLAVAAALVAAPAGRRRLSLSVGAAGLLLALAGPAAYTLDTVATPHTGAIPSAGPVASSSGLGGPGGGRGDGPAGMAMQGSTAAAGMTPPGGGNPPTTSDGQGDGVSPGLDGQSDGDGGVAGAVQPPMDGRRSGGLRDDTGRGGGMGGLLDAGTVGAELVALLQERADEYDWAAATVRANSAAGYQLASDQAVMAIGGFNGTDPAPTLSEFRAYVAAGRIHYYLGGGEGVGGGGGGGESGSASEIAAWVSETFSSQTVDGVTVYDLTDPM